ncbi:MAG: GDSL-type esterase/lipase family protein [Rhodospirillales bacterium]|jgi:lysophospholipase L1-like esterase
MAMRICFFGDSFVNGCGDPALLGWVGRVCARQSQKGHDLTLYNLGIRGDSSSDVLARWAFEAESRLKAHPNRRLVFSFGANDAAQNIPRAISLDHTARILRAAQALAPTLMIGPAPIADDDVSDGRVASLCPQIASLCDTFGIAYLPIHARLRQSTAWMEEARAQDGAHPATGGYSALATLVEDWPHWQAWFQS